MSYLMAEKKQDPRLRTLLEEREYNTIPGSVIATRVALSHSRAQANLTVEHGLLLQKAKIKKLPKDKTKDKATQTELKDKE